MALKKRLIFWLLKAYIKKWGKIVVLFFFIGLIIFFILLYAFQYMTTKIIISKKTIGVVGAYTIDNLPDTILLDISRGLTKIDSSGIAQKDLANSWKVKDNGKTYVLQLQKNIAFSDGSDFTADQIHESFSDVKIDRPDQYTMVFHLKEIYSPFLVTLSHHIFKNDFIGIGDYKVQSIKLNSNFIESLSLVNTKDGRIQKTYQFYPTQDALKVAFALGEISVAKDITDLSFKTAAINTFPNVLLQKNIQYNQLVTVFYNTQDKNLSDKRLRDALAYALPNSFSEGERAHSPLSPKSWAYQADTVHTQDLTHAKILLDASGFDVKATNKNPLLLTVQAKYKQTAEEVIASWKKIGIHGKLDISDTVPSTFQVFLGDFNVPKDPDQYSLWHSYQGNNITNYKNLRIDKLLEDGRKTLEQSSRVKIYADFQKYLADDQPASFLYFPYAYTVSRK